MQPELSRDVADAARAWADTHTDRIADLPPGAYLAKVASVSPLQLSWRGRDVDAFKVVGYAPVVGDWVLFVVVTAQPVIIDKIG